MPLLKACLNGVRLPSEHPALPVTAAELARDAVAVRDAGAGAVHVHVKDDEGADTLDAAALTEVLAAVRSAAPGLPVGVTTGAWAAPDPAARVAAVQAWTSVPDFASVNWHEEGADDVAAVLLDRGIGVEAGLWHVEAVAAWLSSPHRGRCLRVLLELPDGLDAAGTEAETRRLLGAVRDGARSRDRDAAPVLLHGEGSSSWPALRLAAQLGVDARIGLEDVLTMPDGSSATSNAQLVGEAARLLGSPR